MSRYANTSLVASVNDSNGVDAMATGFIVKLARQQ
jgi:hypothetical protein